METNTILEEQSKSKKLRRSADLVYIRQEPNMERCPSPTKPEPAAVIGQCQCACAGSAGDHEFSQRSEIARRITRDGNAMMLSAELALQWKTDTAERTADIIRLVVALI